MRGQVVESAPDRRDDDHRSCAGRAKPGTDQSEQTQRDDDLEIEPVEASTHERAHRDRGRPPGAERQAGRDEELTLLTRISALFGVALCGRPRGVDDHAGGDHTEPPRLFVPALRERRAVDQESGVDDIRSGRAVAPLSRCGSLQVRTAAVVTPAAHPASGSVRGNGRIDHEREGHKTASSGSRPHAAPREEDDTAGGGDDDRVKVSIRHRWPEGSGSRWPSWWMIVGTLLKPPAPQNRGRTRKAIRTAPMKQQSTLPKTTKHTARAAPPDDEAYLSRLDDEFRAGRSRSGRHRHPRREARKTRDLAPERLGTRRS